MWGIIDKNRHSMADKKPANRQKRTAPKTAWTKGQSGNPAGAPKRGESWAELFNQIGDMTGEEVSDKALLWAGKFRKMPKGVTLKQLVVIRAYAALLDESNARLLKEVMDRAEGKTTDKLDVTMDTITVTIKGVDEG